MWKIILFTLLSLFSSSFSLPVTNYEEIEHKCIERALDDFKIMRKSSKLLVNDRPMGYYGFNESSHALITLSIAKTSVKLPMLNVTYHNLIKFDASFNGMKNIDEIGNETFPSLRSLNLSHNAIINVKSQVFSHLKEVEILDLSHNCFVKFHYDHVFVTHENLKKLHLNNNLLHTIGHTSFLPHTLVMDVLDLSHNFLKNFINSGMQVNNLDLSHNSLTSIVIVNAEDMTLNLNHNKLNEFQCLYGGFKTLNLSYNEIEYLVRINFKEAKTLDLSNNKIAKLLDESSEEYVDDFEEDISSESHKFDTLFRSRVEHLNLSNNILTSITDLRHFTGVKSLNLQNNKLTNIVFEYFRVMFPELHKVNLLKNPLNSADETELKYHNDTRFLRLHFEYDHTTQAPLLSTLLPTLPPLILFTTPRTTAATTTTTVKMMKIVTTTSTPRTESTTASTSTTTETQRPLGMTEAQPAGGNSSTHHRLWFVTIVFAAIIVSSIMYVMYSKRCRSGVRVESRSYNEAVNFL